MRIILIAFILSVSTISIHSQEPVEKVGKWIKFGYGASINYLLPHSKISLNDANLAIANLKELEVHGNPGFSVYLEGEKYLNQNISLIAFPQISFKRYTISYLTFFSSTREEMQVKLAFWEIPIYAKYKFPANKVSPWVSIGPNMNIKLSDGSNNVHPLSFSIDISIGATIELKYFDVSNHLTYSTGFTDISKTHQTPFSSTFDQIVLHSISYNLSFMK